MTEKVTIRQVQDLPMPRITFREPQELASWYVDQLDVSLRSGETSLSMSCFDTDLMGFPVQQAAYVVLRAVTDFLYDHPQVERLEILCGDDKAMRGYSLNWNMWYAESKPKDHHHEA